MQFVLYLIFLVSFYLDLESIRYVNEEGLRMKNFQFWGCKIVCLIIQMLLVSYEVF